MDAELDQSAALACTVGLMRMALHQPWSQGGLLVIHISQSSSGAPPTLHIIEPETEPDKSMAEHLLLTAAGHEGQNEQEGQSLHQKMLAQCSKQFLALPESEIKTPMHAFQSAALITAQNSRLTCKMKEEDRFSALLHIQPAARYMSFDAISLND